MGSTMVADPSLANKVWTGHKGIELGDSDIPTTGRSHRAWIEFHNVASTTEDAYERYHQALDRYADNCK